MQKKRLPTKLLSLFIIPALLLGAFCSCGKTPSDAPTENSVTFTDALGREVSVSKDVRNVACLKGSFAEIWQLAGGNVCASAEDGFEDFGLSPEDAVNLGGAHSPGVEMLISSSPDFVLASASTGADIEMKDTISKMGIPIAYFDIDSFDDYLQMMKICTDITGRKDLYKVNALDIKEKIEKLKEDFSSHNIPEEKRTVLVLRASSGFVKAKSSKGTILGEMLMDLGCINIADSDKNLLQNLSAESVIFRNPYHIFVTTMGNDTEAAITRLSKMIKENPAWSEVDAVKENRIHFMDKKLFNLKPNSRWAEAYEQLCEILK